MDEILHCIIVDDDHDAIKALSVLIDDQEGLIFKNGFTDPLLALTEILQQDELVDIAFLDINMPLLSGLELAKRIQGKVKFIVFVTAFHEYSLKAFEVKAMQYLIKPLTKISLIDVICQINQLKLHSKALKPITNLADDGIYILAGAKGQYLRLEITSIILFSAEKNQVHIFTDTGDYIANAGISKVMADLKNDQRFMRIHKSHIIKLNAIKNVSANLVYLHKDYRAPISPLYRTAFFNYIQKRILKNRL